MWSDLRLLVVARGGVEPPTFHFSGGRSYQLSYLAAPPAHRAGDRDAGQPLFPEATRNCTGTAWGRRTGDAHCARSEDRSGLTRSAGAAASPPSASSGDASPPGVREGGAGGVHPGRSVHSSAGVGGGGAEVEAGYAGLGPAQTGHGAEDQLLVQLGGAAVDGAADQVRVAALELARDRGCDARGRRSRSRERASRSGPACGRRTARGRRGPTPRGCPRRRRRRRVSCGTWV